MEKQKTDESIEQEMRARIPATHQANIDHVMLLIRFALGCCHSALALTGTENNLRRAARLLFDACSKLVLAAAGLPTGLDYETLGHNAAKAAEFARLARRARGRCLRILDELEGEAWIRSGLFVTFKAPLADWRDVRWSDGYDMPREAPESNFAAAQRTLRSSADERRKLQEREAGALSDTDTDTGHEGAGI